MRKGNDGLLQRAIRRTAERLAEVCFFEVAYCGRWKRETFVSEVQTIALLGSTGSVGTSCLDVVRCHPDRLRVSGLTAFRSIEKLQHQAAEFNVDWAVLGDSEFSSAGTGPISGGKSGQSSSRTMWYRHLDEIPALVRQPQLDTVVSAIVGAAGLPATWAAVDAGKRIALANKETLVIAGSLVMRRAEETGARVIPVDSEHSAVYQCLQSGRKADLKRIVLTASGGPFRGWTKEQMKTVTPEMALRHPTWKMGPKISVDSATMMNKALEIIEARWLFDVPAERISVVIHPQSIIHSLVEYRDGSVISQMSPPDMRLPIQYALLFPDRPDRPGSQTDWTQQMSLDLFPPDFDAFPALKIGFEVAENGGTSGAVMNGANEVAVARFLNNEIRFDQIIQVVEDILRHHQFDAFPSMEILLKTDAWARKEATRWNT